MQDLSVTKVYYQQTIVVSPRKISENETRGPEHRTIDSSGTLLPKARIFPSQFQKIDMQIVKFAILVSLGQIQFAANKYLWVIRRWQALQRVFLAQR